ncbi:unnamed protein product [Prunus armeniaca]
MRLDLGLVLEISEMEIDWCLALEISVGHNLSLGMVALGISLWVSDTHEDLNDDEDVVISRGEKGPSIQFSDRAMDRLS